MNKQEWLCQRVCESLNAPEKDLKDFVDTELKKVKRLAPDTYEISERKGVE